MTTMIAPAVNICETFAANVRDKLARQDRTLEDLAAIGGFESGSALAAKLANAAELYVTDVVRIARALGTRPSSLFAETVSR